MISFAYSEKNAKDAQRISQVYQSGQFSPGPMCRAFEEKFKTYHHRKHAFFVNSGTDALRMGLLAMKEKYQWPDGAGVIVPAVTFVASVNVIIQAGLTPVFVDVGQGYNMNPWNVRRFFECSDMSHVKAIMVVHLFGQIANMVEIMKIAKERKLRVIEDSCESIGSEQNGRKCGTFGDVACFSTYQCHIIATGVGGMAITDDNQLHELMRSYANHGRDVVYLPGFRKPPISRSLLTKRFRFVRNGYSSRPSEFEAALGIGQMERLEENLHKRREVASSLIKALDVYFELSLPVPEYGNTHSYMMFPILIKERPYGRKVTKKKLVWHLEQCGIETRDMMPITNQPVFKEIASHLDFNGANLINKNGFYIPCHQGITKKDICHIRIAFIDFFKK